MVLKVQQKDKLTDFAVSKASQPFIRTACFNKVENVHLQLNDLMGITKGGGRTESQSVFLLHVPGP